MRPKAATISSCQPEMWIRISRTPQLPSHTARISWSDSPSIVPCSSVNARSVSPSSVAFSLIGGSSRVMGSRCLRAVRPRTGRDVKRGDPSAGEARGGGALDRAIGPLQQDGQAVEHRLHLVALRHQAIALVAEALHLGAELVEAGEVGALVGRHRPRQLEGLTL